MAIETRDFDVMVDDTCQRIVDADVGINNISAGSVTRTLVESILAELDIFNYTSMQIYLAKSIDDAEDGDLDDLISILGVTRNSATYCKGVVVFSITEISDTDIIIGQNQTISTQQDADGTIYEFTTDDEMVLTAGTLSVSVPVTAVDGGYIYIPINCLTIMSTPIIGIESVNNNVAISGGINEESDSDLRLRAKESLSRLGKGTSSAIEQAVNDVDGVIDASVIDMNQGVGTTDIIVTCNIMPPTTEVLANIQLAIANSKSSGIMPYIIYPTTTSVNIVVTTNDGVNADIYDVIIAYVNNLGIGDPLMLAQLTNKILAVLPKDNENADVAFTSPTSSIIASDTEIIRPSSIIINGVTYL